MTISYKKELEIEVCALLNDVLYSLYTVLDEGVFDRDGKTVRVGFSAIGRMNNLLARLDQPGISEEEWIWRRYAPGKAEPSDGKQAAPGYKPGRLRGRHAKSA